MVAVAEAANVPVEVASDEGRVRLEAADGEVAGIGAILRYLGRLSPSAMLFGASESDAGEVDR